MNANWLKQNLLNVILGVVFVVVLAGASWLVWQAHTNKATVETELQAQQEELERLVNGVPYPSKKNIEILRTNHTELVKLFVELTNSVVHSGLEMPVLRREVEFVHFLNEHQKTLREAAANNGVVVPENFAFGFTRYNTTFPCRTPVLRHEECQKLLARLAKEVLVVDQITRLLIGSHVEEISDVRRVDLEQGGTSTDMLPPSALEDPKALYASLPFQFTFKCGTTASLKTFLNQITSTTNIFLTVRNLKIENETLTRTDAASAAGGEKTESRTRLEVTARIELVEFPGLQPPEPPPAAVKHPKRAKEAH